MGASTEKMYARDRVPDGDVNKTLLLEGDGRYRCDFRSTYKYVLMCLRDLATPNKK